MRNAKQYTLYVATDGNDGWSGRLAEPNADRTEGPLATPQRARDLLREREDRSGPATVLLRGGTYFLAEPLRLEPQDSGTTEAPVTWAAYPGERPVLSAGQRVTGWEETTVGEARAWVAPAPEGFFRELWVNGARRFRPRLPKSGLYSIAGLNGPWQPGDPDKGPVKEFRVDPGILGEWRNLGDVDMVVLQRWVECRLPIVALDRERGVVHTALGARFLPILRWATREFSPFYLENVAEALSQAGEWYLDRGEGKLYYLPFPEETPETAEVIAPRLAHVIVVAGDPEGKAWVEHLHFRGLTLAHNEWQKPADQPWWGGGLVGRELGGDGQAAVSVPGAFEAVGMRQGSLRRCTVAHSGSYAIQLGRGCRENVVSGCDMFDLGAGGVKLGTVSVEDAGSSGGNEVSDCHIHDGGLLFHSAVGIWVGQSGDNLLSHNEVNHLYYTGISLGWTWGYKESASKNNVVEYNHLHDLGQRLLSDMGGIYTLGESSGTVLRYNLIHHIESADYGGRGIYHDEGTCGILSERNLVYRCKTECFNQHYGRDNVLRNNIFAIAGEDGVISRSVDEEHLSFTIEGNIIYCLGATALSRQWNNGQFRLNRNLYWEANGRPLRFGKWSFAEWQGHGQDLDSLVANPCFANPEGGDFRISADSPALTLGFEPFDLREVGPRGEVGAGE